jgi:hypothetical protein
MLATTLYLIASALTSAPPPAAAPDTAPGFSGLFTRWDVASREATDAEARTAEPAPPSAPDTNAVPAYSPLAPRSEAEAVALGRRVGEVVRAGDCAEGERIARAAGDLALVRAVREHCRNPR